MYRSNNILNHKHVYLHKNMAAVQSRYGCSKNTGGAKKEYKMSQFKFEIMVLFELAYIECSSEAVFLDSLDRAIATLTHTK